MPNLAKANLLSRKTRTAVTIFGIALSVFLLLVLVGLVNGTVRDFANRILNIGADIMVGGRDMGMFYPTGTFNDKRANVVAEVEGVEMVASVLIESAPSLNHTKQFNYIYGIDYDDYNSLGQGFTFVEGGPLREDRDIMVDTEVARYNKLKVGDSISLLNNEWHVVGIVKKALGARFYIDRLTMGRLVEPARTYGIATLLYVKVKDGFEVGQVAATIEEKLGENWSVRNVRDMFDLIIGGAVGLKEFMVAVIGVSAVICFAVILLSMYNSIIERTREIGILKSLGATKRFIIAQILKEAMIVLILGIFVGIVLSYFATNIIISLFPILQVELSIEWLINGSLIALVATLLGTLYPAWRASTLDPVEALSWE